MPWPRSPPRRLRPALVGIGIAVWSRPVADARLIPVRFSVSPPPGNGFQSDVERTHLAFSPDGSELAFIAGVSGGVRRIWLRPVSGVEPRPLTGTEGANSLFWSPDGRALAFFAGNKLKRLDLPDGAAVPLCDVAEGIGLTGTWGVPTARSCSPRSRATRSWASPPAWERRTR
jgi:WD40 repeat protein